MFGKIIKCLSALLFLAGILFAAWSLVGLHKYFQAKGDNRLPPAGSFIDGPDAFSFALLSDSGFRNEPLNAVIKDIRGKQVKFMFHLGDQARRFSANHFEHLLQEIDRQAGDMPFYSVPGNHDVVDKKGLILRYYERAFGQPYYWFGYGNTLFIALNTADEGLDAAQQAWLRKVLLRVRPGFKRCFLLMHVPPIDPRPGDSYAMSRDVDALRKIITGAGIDVIFSGHIHEYNASTFAGIPLYIIPPSGQKMRGRTTMYGYLLCTVDKNGKTTVKKVDVTEKMGRDYLAYALSTGLDGITSATIAFALLAGAYILLLAAGFLPGKKTAGRTTEEKE